MYSISTANVIFRLTNELYYIFTLSSDIDFVQQWQIYKFSFPLRKLLHINHKRNTYMILDFEELQKFDKLYLNVF